MSDEGVTHEHARAVVSIFEEKYGRAISQGEYDQRDVERLKQEDAYACRFYYHQKENKEKAAAMIDAAFKWRLSVGICDLTEHYFPRWMHEMGGLFFHNKTKEGHNMLHFKVSKCKKDPENQMLIKKFIAWNIEKENRKAPDKPIVVLFDMTGAGISNMDIDIVKFLISCFASYFPAYLGYMLVYEMPWVLNAIWKVIKNILNEEQQKRVIFIKKSEIQRYIDENNLFIHMGGNDNFEYQYLPSEDSGIELPNGDMSPMDINDKHFAESTSESTLRKRVTFSQEEVTVNTFTSNPEETNAAEDESSQKGESAESNAVPAEATSVFKGTLVNISPAEQFVFNVTDETKETIDLLSITNMHSKTVAYKVKTTSPENYRVRPSTHLIKPGRSIKINVYLQPGCYDSVPRDKFLIMVMEVEEGVKSISEVNDRWRNPPRDSDRYMEHRLFCKCQRPVTQQEPVKEPLEVVQEQLSNVVKQVCPKCDQQDEYMDDAMDTLLQQQDLLQHKLRRLFHFQVVIIALVLLVLIFFLTLYLTDWHMLSDVTDLLKSCTPHEWRS